MHLIAEAGNNHNGDVETGLELVEVAHRAGADSVKFQIIHPEQLYLPEIPTENGYAENEVIAARRRHQLSADDYRRLAARCGELGIAFSASVFDTDGIALLDELDVEYMKIASCDLDNLRLIRAAAATGRRVVLSTGMATLAEVERSVEALEAEGEVDLVLLHCVSVYPAPLERMNVRFIERLAEFGYACGLSDHTDGTTAATMALALGASWFEKHFTLDRDQEGFDHAYAREPEELAAYARELHAAQQALAEPERKVGEDEAGVAERARRSVYAARDLPDGHELAADDLLVVRPQGELTAAEADRLVGATLTAPLRRYEPLTREAVEEG